MVSQGRALAVATAWIVVPLAAAALVVSLIAGRSDNPLDAIVIALAWNAAFVLSLLGVLAGAVWVARRGTRARSSAVLGAQAGLIGLLAAAGGVALFAALHQ